MSGAAPITVIVPVYRGLHDVKRCLESVWRHQEPRGPAIELLVINDASPEAEISAYLDHEVTELSPVPTALLRNAQNLGFAASINRGLRRATGDVILLNADTVVTADWIEHLAEASRGGDVATVTPLTNSGSICTLPSAVLDAFDLTGPNPRVDDCASFVTEHSLGLLPEVITGVGFCMYVTRKALDLCGLLDEQTFGAGYGEEVDFCLRAAAAGLVHRVDDSTFVFHRGGGSFGAQRTEQMARGSARVHDRHRSFRADNTRERLEDPLRVSFTALELGLTEREAARPHVLHLIHTPSSFGGTEMHARSLMESLLADIDFSILYPTENGFVLRTLWSGEADDPIELEFLLPAEAGNGSEIDNAAAAEALRTTLDMFDFDAVHIQNLIGHSPAALEVLEGFPGQVVCSVHDLYLACPSYSLLYKNQVSCGLPDNAAICDRCLPETSVAQPVTYLKKFRQTVDSRLGTVDHWVFASRSAADFMLRVYDLPPERVEIIEHGSIIDTDRMGDHPIDENLIFDQPLRLAFVGRGWTKKGLTVVNDLAGHFTDTPVEIHHFGELKEPAASELHLHGPYDNRQLPELLRHAGIQIVLLPGPYAETFGLVMTESLLAGLPVIGARYGALGERIRAHGAGWTIDPEDTPGIRALIENLDRCRAEVLRATDRARQVPIRSVADTAARYATLYQSAPIADREEEVSTTDRREQLQRRLGAAGARQRELQAQLAAVHRRHRKRRPTLPFDPVGPDRYDLPAPHLVQGPQGPIHLIDHGRRRQVRSGLLVAALERELGRRQQVSADELDRWDDDVAVQVLEGPNGAPFVVVGGERRPIGGLPLPHPVGETEDMAFPEGDELDLLPPRPSSALPRLTAEGPLPTFVIIGAQKSATRWLQTNLDRHPDIYVAPRELSFFNQKRGVEWYRGQFEDWEGQPLIGESTPGYMMWRNDPEAVAGRMQKIIPDIRLIAILRNPVDRAISAIVHHTRRGRLPADADPLDLLQQVAPEDDPLGLVSGGWYAASLQPYLRLFGDQLLILLHDDLRKNPRALFDRALRHLGAPPDFVPAHLERVRFNDQALTPELSPEERAGIHCFFEDDIGQLESMINRDLSIWGPDRTTRDLEIEPGADPDPDRDPAPDQDPTSGLQGADNGTGS